MPWKRPPRLALVPQRLQQHDHYQPAKTESVTTDQDAATGSQPTAARAISNDQEEQQIKSLGERFLVMMSAFTRLCQMPASSPMSSSFPPQVSDPPVSPLLEKLRSELPRLQVSPPLVSTSTPSSPSRLVKEDIDISPYFPLPLEQRQSKLASPIKRKRRKRRRRRRKIARQWCTSHVTWTLRAAELHRKTRAPYDPRTPHVKALVNEIGQLDRSFNDMQRQSRHSDTQGRQFLYLHTNAAKRMVAGSRDQVYDDDGVDDDQDEEEDDEEEEAGSKEDEDEDEYEYGDEQEEENGESGAGDPEVTERTKETETINNESPETASDSANSRSAAPQLPNEPPETSSLSVDQTETTRQDDQNQRDVEHALVDQDHHDHLALFPTTPIALESLGNEPEPQLKSQSTLEELQTPKSISPETTLKQTDETTRGHPEDRRPIHHHAVWISDELRSWLIETGMFQTRDKSEIALSRMQQLRGQQV